MADTLKRCGKSCGYYIADTLGSCGGYIADTLGSCGNYIADTLGSCGDYIADTLGSCGNYIADTRGSCGNYIADTPGFLETILFSVMVKESPRKAVENPKKSFKKNCQNYFDCVADDFRKTFFSKKLVGGPFFFKVRVVGALLVQTPCVQKGRKKFWKHFYIWIW